MDVEIIVGASGTSAMIQENDKQVGSIIAHDDAMAEIVARIGDITPAAIRDRCYSLVQSIARFQGDGAGAYLDASRTWEDEAAAIVKDAGW